MPAINFTLQSFTPHAGGSVDFILQEIGGPSLPVVNAGADVSGHALGTPFVRTATEDDGGSPITVREWRIAAGPVDVGLILSTAALVDWTPTVAGGYVLIYEAANAVGPASDSVSVVVGSTANVLHFFPIGGQSNAIYGVGDTSTDAPNPEPGTAYNYTGTALESLDDKGGFAPAFAVAYYNATGHKVLFNNQAVGAAAQQYLANPTNNWSDQLPNRYSYAVNQWLQTKSEVEALGYTVVVKGVLWDQGGRDAIQMMAGVEGVTAEEYEVQAIAMIARLRSDFGIPDLPIYIIRLGRRRDGDVPEWAAIRDKQDAIVAADPNVHFIHTGAATTDASNYFDMHHYMQSYYNEIGTEGGQYVASLSAVTLQPTAIPSSTVVGEPTIVEGVGGPDTIVVGATIPSVAVVGEPVIQEGGVSEVVTPTSIPSATQVGVPTIEEGVPNAPEAIFVSAIPSATVVHEPTLVSVVLDEVHDQLFTASIDNRIYAGSSGFLIKLTLLYREGTYNPAFAPTKGLIIRKKGDQPVMRENVTVGTDENGRMTLVYRTTEDDFPTPGNYRLQGFGTDPSAKWFSIIKRVRIYPSLLEV